MDATVSLIIHKISKNVVTISVEETVSLIDLPKPAVKIVIALIRSCIWG